MSRVVAVVPGRMESTRFPGKMLADRSGTPLIVHCAENAAEAACIDHVCIASDSEAIARASAEAGIEHHMTRRDHPNGTSRIAEIAESLNAGIIVNVQGDEPDLPGEVIDATVEALQHDLDAGVATAASHMLDATQGDDPNVVKVVRDTAGRALLFSRASIPHDRDGGGSTQLRHVGIYAYRPEALLDYIALPEGELERAEKLEQLRLLEHGRPIAVALVDSAHAGIDTPEQYEAWLQRRF